MIRHILDFLFPHRKQIRDLETDLYTIRNELAELKKEVFPDEKKIIQKIPLSKEDRILSFLNVPRTTTETAHYFAESRTWISLQLNKLERMGKIREVSRSVKGKFYQTIK